MKKCFVGFIFIFSINILSAQPCIKFYNYENSTFIFYKSGDKISVLLEQENKEQRFRIKSISDSGFISTTNQFISLKKISAIAYASSGRKILCYYLLIDFIGLPFSFFDINNSPFYILNKAVAIPIATVSAGIGVYVMYKLNIRNGFRKIYKLDKVNFELKFFDDISKATN